MYSIVCRLNAPALTEHLPDRGDDLWIRPCVTRVCIEVM
jgi:hypothetical protein